MRVVEVCMTTINTSFRNLADRPLLDTAKRLAADERRATSALLRALMEIDERRLYLGEGCASMFVYCTAVLHLSEGGAYNRIEAARAARRYPVILDLFEQSAVTLTAIRLLAPHLTADNHAAVLASARHKSKREIEEIVAALRPKPDAVTMVRRLPPAGTDSRALPVSAATPPSEEESGPSTSPARDVRREPTVAAAGPTPIVPLAPARYRIQLTVSRETHDKLRRAQALLRHAVPSGDPAEIIDRALTRLIEDLERRRFAATAHPRTRTPAAQRSRHIPAAVRRSVWQRDGGRCAFAGPEGRCREVGFLEFHHIEPYAGGGAATAENIQLRCRAHNQYEARVLFGADVVREPRPSSITSAISTRSGTSPCVSWRSDVIGGIPRPRTSTTAARRCKKTKRSGRRTRQNPTGGS